MLKFIQGPDMTLVVELIPDDEEGGFTARIPDTPAYGGSHHFLERGSTHTTVPAHGSRNLKIGTLRGILRDVEISPAEFERLLHDG